eukprot:5790088-Prymnesium_polylepis.1
MEARRDADRVFFTPCQPVRQSVTQSSPGRYMRHPAAFFGSLHSGVVSADTAHDRHVMASGPRASGCAKS